MYSAQSESLAVAETIESIQKIYKNLDLQYSNNTAGTSRVQDFRVCYTYALLQKFILSDLQQHDMYIAKLNSQREMLRMLKNNMLQS